jgi:hypothetical protein
VDRGKSVAGNPRVGFYNVGLPALIANHTSIPPTMTPKTKRRLSILGGVIAIIAALGLYYVRTHPLVFNESFWGHAHCMKGGGLGLLGYAGEHGGQFPFHTNGYGDALLLVNDGWDAALTGPGYDTLIFDRVRMTGEDAPENEFGRVYVQGLSNTNNPEIALLFDKLPTPGGDHCHLVRRIFAPLGRETWTIGGGMRFIPESRWPAFAGEQIELLVAAGIVREQAERYYAERPKP